MRREDIFDRIARAEQDLLLFKTSQPFGRDVTSPKVIQRYNSDGTPTEWDVIGEWVPFYPGAPANEGRYQANGQLIYKAKSQEFPRAVVYADIRINPSDEIISTDAGNVDARPVIDDLFSGQGLIRFDIRALSSHMDGTPETRDPTVDRLWVKLYVLSTDTGEIELKFPYGFKGAGNIVELT